MTEAKLLSLIKESAFTRTSELIQSTGMSLEELNRILERLASDPESAPFQLLYLFSKSDGYSGRRLVLQKNKEEAQNPMTSSSENLSLGLYAVLPRSRLASGLQHAEMLSAAFIPNAPITVRKYPTTTRANIEEGNKQVESSPAPCDIRGDSVSVTHAPTVAGVVQTSAQSNSLTSTRTSPFPPLSTVSAPLKIEKSILSNSKAKPPDPDHAPAESCPFPRAEPSGHQQRSLVDLMMKGSDPHKRPKGFDLDAKLTGGKLKKSKSEKKDEKEQKTTKSITRLARASVKKKVNTLEPRQVPIQPHLSVLDDEECPHNEETCFDEASYGQRIGDEIKGLNEEASAMEVVISTVNDDIIVCDDTAPLAFLAPQPALEQQRSRVPPLKGVSNPFFSISSVSQSTLNLFLNGQVVDFQKKYLRELRTDTKIVNDEYICVDVPYYRSTIDNSLITEEEYHQRSMEIMTKHRQEEGRTHGMGEEGAGTSQSPCAARTVSKPSVKLSVSKQALKEKLPHGRNLLSFFRPK